MKRRDFLKVATAAPLMPSLALAHNPLPHSSFPESIMTASLSESSGVLNVLERQVPHDMFGRRRISDILVMHCNV